MVTIKTYNNTGEAGVARSVLESNGIQCFVTEENSHTVGNPAGGIGIQVSEEDEAEARRLLDRGEELEVLPEDFVPPQPDRGAPPRSAGPDRSKRKGGLLATFVRGGLWSLAALGLLAAITMAMGGRFAVNPRAMVFLFAFGGIVALVVRMVSQPRR